jgi:hypothetical protein
MSRGQDVPEMFCLVTDLAGIQEYPAQQLAGPISGGGTGGDRAARGRGIPGRGRADATRRQPSRAQAWSGRNSLPRPLAPR